MEALFLKLVDMSRSAGWLVLAVLALRLVLKKAPKWINCCLWALVAIRLVCPFSVESVYSLIPNTETIPVEAISVPVESSAVPEMENMEDYALATESFLHQTTEPEKSLEPVAPVHTVRDWVSLFAVIWLVGMAVLAAYAAFSCVRLKKKVAASISLSDNVLLCDYIDTPFILGILKPKIYLPSSLLPESAAYVLAHEKAHLCRRDHWWKPLGYLLLSIYWFHPLIWAAYILLCRDIELACDEYVIKEMGTSEKKAYSEALLQCSVPRHMIAACPLAFGEVGVKERIRSVLSYKKPGFRIMVIALVLCIVVAVCFLTDPQTTISDLFPAPRDSLTCIDLWTDIGHTCLSADREMEAVWNLLDTVSCDPEPYTQETLDGYLEIYGDNHHIIRFFDEDQQWDLYVLRDYSGICLTGKELTMETDPLYYYHVHDPDALEAFFAKYMNPVIGPEATAEPFAAADDPYSWVKNISIDAVSEAREYSQLRKGSTTSTSSGTMSEVRFLEFLDVLNTLPEEAFGAGEPYYSTSTDQFNYKNTHHPNVSVAIPDKANSLTASIRYYQDITGAEETLDILLSGSNGITRWEISNDALMAFMRELCEHPAYISLTIGYWVDWVDEDPLTVSHGNVIISTPMIKGWDYEAVEYTDGGASFGIRCRPGDVEEGWLYFSFWPEGYDPVEEDRFYMEGLSNGYRTVTSWPSAVSSRRGYNTEGFICSYFKTEYPIGDYAVINDGMDEWYRDYEDYIKVIRTYTSFDYGTHATPDVLSYGGVTVDISQIPSEKEPFRFRYFDWDIIAAQLKTDKLTLFDPKEYGDYLFVGCEYGEKYAAVVFRTDEDGNFRFVGVEDTAFSLTLEDQVCGYQISCETEGTGLTLCMITDDAVTGLRCDSGYQDYIRISGHPALIVLDESLWGEEYDIHFTLCSDEPPQIAYSLSTFHNALWFHQPEENSGKAVYLYNCMVLYSDGALEYGGYFLDNDGLAELADYLARLPEDAIVRGSEPAESVKFVTMQLYADDGQEEDLSGATMFNLNYDGETVTLSTTVVQELLYGNEEKTLYFQIEDEAFKDYIESLIDPSRKTMRIRGPGDPVTVEYSYQYASIRIAPRDTWEWEIVEYTDDQTPFGIRYRPKGHEGWLYLQFCPNGFAADPEWTHSSWPGSFGDKFKYLEYNPKDGDPTNFDDWAAWVFTNLPGTYAVVNENAAWMEEFSREAMEVLGGMELSAGMIAYEEVMNIARPLLGDYTEKAIASAGYISEDIIYRPIETAFDFHTGIWTLSREVYETGEILTVMQIDAKGNIL